MSAEVLAVLAGASDLSAGSPELALAVDSADTAGHFSPARLGVLAPLRLRPGSRALDLRCGSGVFVRALAEAGLRVVGRELDPHLAEAAALRCRDLDGVRIVAEVPHGEWDLVLAEPDDLHLVASCLAEGGVAVIITRNAMAVGGQPEPGWTRADLAGALRAAGLPGQRWLHAYPDIVLPRVLLDDSAFTCADPNLVDKLVRHPLLGAAAPAEAFIACRDVHRQAVANGVGHTVAPGFIVLAARTDDEVSATAEPGLAWLTAGARMPQWRRTRMIDRDMRLRTVRRGTPVHHPWLRQNVPDTEDVVVGRGLDAVVLDALRVGDTDAAGKLLHVWRTTCLESGVALRDDHVRHPFLPGTAGVPVLPADRLDVHPGNLIVDERDGVVRVDQEWAAGSGVDAELVLLRGLLEFAREILLGGAVHPWPATGTVFGLLEHLCALVDLSDALGRRWTELPAAEAQFQSAVHGRDPARIAEALAAGATAEPAEPLWRVPGGLAELRGDRSRRYRAEQDVEREQAKSTELTKNIAGLTAALAVEADRAALAEHAVTSARAELDTLEDRLALAFAELAETVEQAGAAWRALDDADTTARGLVDRLARTRARLDALESSNLVRRAHRTLWPAARLARGLRDVLAARPGEEPDAVLRRLGERAPAAANRLAGRYRRAAAGARESGLRFDVVLPAAPVPTGRGQVIEVTGWVVHAAVGIRAVNLVADGRTIEAEFGGHRPDVSAALRAAGIRAPDGSGLHARIPVADRGTVPLTLVVELIDGTVLRRELPELRVADASPIRPLAARWPGGGYRVAICLAMYRPDIDFLRLQLASIRDQDHGNWFCVLSDDGSDESTVDQVRALIADDPRFFLVTHEDNVGFYANFGRALELAPADADAVALCDQDDIWDRDKLSTLVAALGDPAVTLAYADMRLIDEHGEPVAESFWRHRVNQCADLESLLFMNTVTGAASMIRGDVLRERALPLPPGTVSAFHDHWLALTALAAGKIAFIDRPLHSYRQHAANITGRRDDRLDTGLPSGSLGWLRLAAGRVAWSEKQAVELDAVAEFELRRIAQFATVLLARNADRITPDLLARLADLARVEKSTGALVRLVRRRPTATAGAERRLLAAALRLRTLRGPRRRSAPLPSAPLD